MATRTRMRLQRRRDTKPEMVLRRLLHGRGLRYRTSLRGLPGSPDIAFTRARLVVFVDGCYWHRCPVHATDPKTNGAWWQAKFAANVARDRRQTAELEQLGWTVLRVWEHEDMHLVADRVEELWRYGASSGAGHRTAQSAVTLVDPRRANAGASDDGLGRTRPTACDG